VQTQWSIKRCTTPDVCVITDLSSVNWVDRYVKT